MNQTTDDLALSLREYQEIYDEIELQPRCYFDKDKTERLVECLKRYRRAIHTQTGEPMGPLHDEFSHGADMFRYIAQAIPVMTNDTAPEYQESEAPDWRL